MQFFKAVFGQDVSERFACITEILGYLVEQVNMREPPEEMLS